MVMSVLNLLIFSHLSILNFLLLGNTRGNGCTRDQLSHTYEFLKRFDFDFSIVKFSFLLWLLSVFWEAPR